MSWSNVGSGTSAASPARSGRPMRTARSTARATGLERAGEVRGQALGAGEGDHQTARRNVIEHSIAEGERLPVPVPAVLVSMQPHRLAAGALGPGHRGGTVSGDCRLGPVVRQGEHHGVCARGVGLDRLRRATMQRGPLTGVQPGDDRVPDEVVGEPPLPSPVAIDHQRGAARLLQPGEAVAHVAPRHRRDDRDREPGPEQRRRTQRTPRSPATAARGAG